MESFLSLQDLTEAEPSDDKSKIELRKEFRHFSRQANVPISSK